MRLGISERSVLGIFPQGLEIYNKCASLEKFFKTIADPDFKVEEGKEHVL
jgi:hypothetical protein